MAVIINVMNLYDNHIKFTIKCQYTVNLAKKYHKFTLKLTIPCQQQKAANCFLRFVKFISRLQKIFLFMAQPLIKGCAYHKYLK